jgi:DNA-binding NarL/FixJ family response regulator
MECLPKQLQLGHVNLVTQELGSRPHIAALVLRDKSSETLALPLLTALSRHWDFRRASQILGDGAPPRIGRLVKELVESASPAGCEERTPLPRSRGGRKDSRTPTALDDLTPKELAVLRLMAANRSNAEIATELFIALSTVKTHVNHILSKLQQTNRIGAVLEYQRLTRPINGNDAIGRPEPTSPPGQ